ncbi:MAG: phosphodiesterase/alkaline phosphatase D-like protein [Polaribacter sp.]|jgi:phosphodiesterase/alkaline phosphatase D-like protein
MKKLSQRQAIKTVSGALLVIPTGKVPDSVFKHGIASGDRDSTSVVIWTRISNTKLTVQVNWTVEDTNFLKIVKA